MIYLGVDAGKEFYTCPFCGKQYIEKIKKEVENVVL
jgi:uncharacterized Zn-finger protein